MKGDYSRDTFDPAKHFTRVLMQQGRVQLDADWNEQAALSAAAKGKTIIAVKVGRSEKGRAAVQAHTDIASVRGVGISLVGLAAAEAVDGRPDRAAQIAAAAEVHAQEEGIVVVYSDETPGRELVEQARAVLSPEDLARATELGRRLTIEEALDLANQGLP